MSETWMSNRILINGLWPEADFTESEKELFNKAFENLNQEWLKEAIEQAAMNNVGRKPYVKWIKAEFRKVKEGHTPADFRKDIHRKAETPAEYEEQFNHARAYIRKFPKDTLEECAKIVRKKTSLTVDVAEDVDTWSKIAVSMMATVLEQKGYAHD